MFFRRRARTILASIFVVTLAAACAQDSSTTPTPTQSGQASGPTETADPSQSNNSLTLTIWLPPQFDPSGSGAAATILADRLEQFSSQHPQVQIIARVKSEEGAGGMLDSLLSAQTAAPLALPDLVLLPSGLLAGATENEIAQPLGELAGVLDSGDWYPFALQMATWDGNGYGLPFAADALALAYRSTAVTKAPSDWQDLLSARHALGFPAADPQALFVMAELLSIQQGDPDATQLEISDETLNKVFVFLADGQQREIFPFWLTQYQTNEQTWQAFTEGRVPMTVAWTSQVFTSTQGEIVGAPLPTENGELFSLARGWVWTIVSTNPNRAQAAAELAEFLSATEFLAQYSAAAGLLPPKASALAAWTPDADQALASQIISSINAAPDQATLEKWGNALSPAVIALLKQEMTPAEALQSVRAVLAE